MANTNENDVLIKITSSIIANQIAYNLNHEIRYTGYFKHKLKKVLKLVDVELKKAEKEEYEKYCNEKEEIADAIHNVQYDLINEISTLGLIHFQNLTEIIKAYKIDQKSIEGIVQKINKRKKQ